MDERISPKCFVLGPNDFILGDTSSIIDNTLFILLEAQCICISGASEKKIEITLTCGRKNYF